MKYCDEGLESDCDDLDECSLIWHLDSNPVEIEEFIDDEKEE